jgi:hypothetical protein
MKIENVVVAGIEEAIDSSKFAFEGKGVESSDKPASDVALGLSQAKPGSGHDGFLKTILLAMDVTATKQWWLEWSRYSFSDIGQSESTMHRLKDFDLDLVYIEYVDKMIVERMKVLQAQYKENPTKENLYRLLYSNPSGIELKARIHSNYLQEKTIYLQRKDHALKPEWGPYTAWQKSLPRSYFIVGSTENKK